MNIVNSEFLEMQEWYSMLPDAWKKIFEINLILNESTAPPTYPYISLKNLISLEGVRYDYSKEPSPTITETDLLKLLSIKFIFCNSEPIEDISPLSYLRQLRHVCLFKCEKIITLYPISQSKSIESVDFSYTAVFTLSDLENLPILKKISCWKAPIPKEKVQDFSTRHVHIQIEGGSGV